MDASRISHLGQYLRQAAAGHLRSAFTFNLTRVPPRECGSYAIEAGRRRVDRNDTRPM